MNKLLIVEDDPMLAEIYEKKFKQAGYQVFLAANGTDAEKAAAKERPEVLLLDLVLPEEDGFEVLKRLKASDETRDISVVIFSNLSQDEDKEKAKALGAVGFIAKSDFTPQQIVDEVRPYFSSNENREKKGGESVVMDLADEVPAASPAPNPAMVEQNGRKKVLIIEDEEVFVEVFGTKLEQDGFKVETAKNGVWGIEKISKQRYDAILLDMLMPEAEGLEVVHKIREGGLNKETPVIAFSNSIEDEKIQEILHAGATDVMIKSRITPSELSQKVTALLN